MKEYSLIILNPPFSNGCKHLLKALEMQQRNGGAVVCLDLGRLCGLVHRKSEVV